MMMKPEKQKDPKNKQKQDISKSTQNLLYMISPLDTATHRQFTKLTKLADLQKIQSIYQPETDPIAGTQFLKTPYNSYKNPQTDTISYRSPHSNHYYPPLPQQLLNSQNTNNIYPSPLVRNIEEKGQLLFQEYTKMYYGEDGVIANFYVEENVDQFVFVFCLQKRIQEEGCCGIWNSTNIANISGDPVKSITYKVTTSIIYEMTSPEPHPFTITGNIKRTKTEQKKLTNQTQLDDIHLQSIGRLIQQNQSYLRQQIQSVYARKTKQIIYKIRVPQTKETMENQRKTLKGLLEMNLGKKEGTVEF